MAKKTVKSKLIPLLTAGILACAPLAAHIPTLSAYIGDKTKAESPVSNFYYSQLDDFSKKFYNAIADMEKTGVLKTGTEGYDLCENGVLTQSELAMYSANPSKILSAFGAARDAYTLDNPDVFYVDFSRLSVRAGYKTTDVGKTYTAKLGTGRADNYYYAEQGALKSSAEVDAAIAEYAAKKAEIVDGAKVLDGAYEKVKYVNKKIIENNTYGFGFTSSNGTVTYDDAYPFVHTSYGALVKSESVCEGYARSFKSVLDELGIPCVLVQGYAALGAAYEPHMWNAVQLDGKWYGTDVTWNDTTGKETDYLLRSADSISKEHIADGVVSEANYEFSYPTLADVNYGTETTESGIQIRTEYTEADGIKRLEIEVSFNGKGAAKLEADDNLYLVMRQGVEKNGEIAWDDWCSLSRAEEHFAGGIENTDALTKLIIGPTVEFVQFAALKVAPDSDKPFTPYAYKLETVTPENTAASGDFIQNAAFGTYAPPPYVKHMVPSEQKTHDVLGTHSVTIEYTEKLKLVDGSQPAGITFSASTGGAEKYSELKDFKWDGDSTVTFTFTGSPMYQHDRTFYYFTLVNLVGADGGKRPNSAVLALERDSYVCSKCMDNGGLYMDIYGKPEILADKDLSETDFVDGEGNIYGENQRSQLMLVTTRTAKADSEAMTDSAAEQAGVEKTDVLSSETYEISLNICGKYAKIPNGSYMKLGLGFPEGYGPNDAGVTFKVYHFKRGDDGKIDPTKTEEIECVVTEYGLIVVVEDFSPFAVVAVKSGAITEQKKSVYIRTSEGGTAEVEGKRGVFSLAQSESATVRITPDAGYDIESVKINGKETAVEGNAVQLAYADLQANNTVDVSFVAKRVTEKEKADGITAIVPEFETADPMGTISVSVDGNRSVAAGETLTVSANVTSENSRIEGELFYEWYKNGVLVGDQKDLVIENAQDSDAGEYTFVVKKKYGTRTISNSGKISLSVGNGAPEKPNVGLIVGLVLGGVVIVLGAVAAVIIFKRKKTDDGSDKKNKSSRG